MLNSDANFPQQVELISVVIPTYNRAHTLFRALDSVLQQTYPNIEMIVIDDGSTDGTHPIMQQYGDHQHALMPIHYYQQSNLGVSVARNQGIALSRGDYIALLDSDDAWHPYKLERQAQQLKQNPHHALCHTNEIWYRHGEFVNPKRKHQKKGGWIFQHCLPLCAISPSSALIRGEIFTELGGFDETLPACEDYDLWLRVTARYPVSYLQQPFTYKYGGHADQLSKQYWGMDRFRIQALTKILDSGCLSAADWAAACNMLHSKIAIYLQGARKRGKSDEIDYYENLRKIYRVADTSHHCDRIDG